MKTTMNELRALVDAILAEAKKSKKKKEQPNRMQTTQPSQYTYDEALNFMYEFEHPSLYKMQGASSWGPNTASTPVVDDSPSFSYGNRFNESVDPNSEWARLVESNENVWESAARWYDHLGRGLGEGSGVLDEKGGFNPFLKFAKKGKKKGKKAPPFGKKK